MTWWIKIGKKHQIKLWVDELRLCICSIENDIRTEKEIQAKCDEEIKEICITNMDNEERDLTKLMNPKNIEYQLLEPVARKIATSEERVLIFKQEKWELKCFIDVLVEEKSTLDSDVDIIIDVYIRTAPYIFNYRAVGAFNDIFRKLLDISGHNKRLHECITSDWRPSYDIEVTINRHTVEKIRAALKMKLSTIVTKQLREYEAALEIGVEFDKKEKF